MSKPYFPSFPEHSIIETNPSLPTLFATVSTLHKNLSIPVTAKFRIFPDVNKTIEYAQMMEKAGASILTCHGRTREMKGHNTVSV
jgi:tRNA-dihydrouridine synthase 1